MAKKFKDLAGACWKGYKAVGLKDKNGRKVPNCVPEEVQMEGKRDEEETADRVERSDYKVSPTGRKTHKQIVFKMGEEDLKEGTVSKKDYSWGKMITVYHGKDVSYPLHPEHQKIVKDLRPSGEHSKAMYKDETGKQVHVTRENDKVHFVSHRTSGSKKTTVDYKHFDESVPAKNTDIADKSYLKDMGKKPTVKSDLKNFKNFLTGKKETNEEVEKISEAAPFKNKEDAVKYAKEKVKTHRDNLDGIEIYSHSGGFDVNHTSNSSGRNSLKSVGAKHLGTIYKEEVEQVEEGWYQKPASAYRRKGDEIGGGSSKNDVPFDGPYTKTKPAKNSDGTTQQPMSRARQLAKDAMKKQMKEDIDRLFEKDEQEYGYEGDMALNQLATLTRCADMIKDMLKPDTDLPEWVQSKITLATDYIQTAADYMYSELKEGMYSSDVERAFPNGKASGVKTHAPVAPVPDRKYIKGTPENKALRAKNKPINGHPTGKYNEEVELDEDISKMSTDKLKKHWDTHKDQTGASPVFAAQLKKVAKELAKRKALNKEEVEQIDELDQKTLKSYVNKNLKTGDTSGKRDDGLYRATNKIAKKQATSTLDKKVKTLGNTRPADQKNRYEYEASRSELKDRGIHWFAGRRTTKEEVELDEANHREFASQGKMHPDMAKHMSVGNEMDFYAHGTGDKMSGKVLKNDGKEVHIKTTINPYKEKDSSVHKFKVASKLDEELKGNQHKLDKNKNGKLDKQDFKLINKEDFENGEVETNVKSYKEFLQSLDEIKLSDLPSRKVTGKYGTEYYKGEAEADKKGYDDEDKPAKPAGEKRGRGRPAGSTSGARQKGTIAKRKGSGVEMTGYPVHLPNFK